jgi:hypothetical protein
MTRMGEGMARQMELVGGMSNRWLSAGREITKKAA